MIATPEAAKGVPALPALKGKRLQLRALEPGDAESLYAAVEGSRELLRRRLGWARGIAGPSDEEDFIARSRLAASRGEALVWGVFEPRARRLLGVVGLHDLEGARRSKGRAGFWTRSGAQSRGYATEALRLAIEHAFRKLGLHRVYARIDPANRPARRVLKKLGFQYEGCLQDDKRLNGRWVDQECWGLLREGWGR